MSTKQSKYQPLIEVMELDATNLMSVTTYACYTFKPEVEYITWKAGSFKERNNEASKATINMQPDVILLCKP